VLLVHSYLDQRHHEKYVSRTRMQSAEVRCAVRVESVINRRQGRTSDMKWITIAALAGTAVLCAGAAGAQGVDFSKVEIKTTDLGNKT
jgi:hypothetical protein